MLAFLSFLLFFVCLFVFKDKPEDFCFLFVFFGVEVNLVLGFVLLKILGLCHAFIRSFLDGVRTCLFWLLLVHWFG